MIQSFFDTTRVISGRTTKEFKMTILNLEAVENYLATGKRLTEKEAYKVMEQAMEEGKTTYMLWKLYNKQYEKWYKAVKDNINTTLEQETLYIVSSNNKAFGNFGGYSIFAHSIGQYLRGEVDYTIDRIEHCPIEYAIVINIEEIFKKGGKQ